MAGVDVTRGAVQKAMSSCVTVSNELQTASRKLTEQYNSAGSGWKDAKYRELGEIISECNAAIKSPVSQLADCYKSLKELDAIIAEYENA